MRQTARRLDARSPGTAQDRPDARRSDRPVRSGGPHSWLRRRLRRWPRVVVANVGIVVTGGAVRLTGSGLGCPTWPRCTDESYIATAEMGIHGAIEFGNRMLTFVARARSRSPAGRRRWRLRRRPPARCGARPSLAFLGIPAQGVVGGITVLTDLNPWVVGGHFLVSIGVIASAYAFWRAAGGGPAYRRPAPRPLRWLAGRTSRSPPRCWCSGRS